MSPGSPRIKKLISIAVPLLLADIRGVGALGSNSLSGQSHSGSDLVYAANPAAVVVANNRTGEGLCWGEAGTGGNCTGINFTGVSSIHGSIFNFFGVKGDIGSTPVQWGWVDGCASSDMWEGTTDLYILRHPGVVTLNKDSGTGKCCGIKLYFSPAEDFGDACGSDVFGPAGNQRPGLNIDFSGVTDVYAANYALVLFNRNMGTASC
eukprot:TRINITY_DN17524_c0_g1_i4.p1 TRINITY_DN17524_c0_g1~~TRINITY_DN17524_c0_g1_i4.p1  ORF type:complete len:207 (+),score=20.32 TRINITY_DN17524_c0_g1_i4:141-761(+)